MAATDGRTIPFRAQSIPKKAGIVMLWILSIILISSAILIIFLLFLSPGRPSSSGKVEKTFVGINGLKQGMFIEGADSAKPVLLILHGGPGMPEYFLTRKYPTGLERHFVVCWWEQRGAGLSYADGIPPESMTIDQFVSDTIAVTDYLRARFKQEKIYLMGHSWGSYLGIQVAAAAPERYRAYIGMAQITFQLESERLSRAYMIRRYRELGDRKMAARLEAAPIGATAPLPPAYEAMRDKAMHGLGVGTTRGMKSVISGIFLPSWSFPGYTLGEKLKLWRGKIFSRRSDLWDRMQAADLAERITELAVPVYFIHGIHDYTVSYSLARAYFDLLQAPRKGFYSFELSAHSPFFEEPEKMARILREDVLTGRLDLADRMHDD